MGCAGSRFEALPVTGHQSGLSVIDAIPIKTIEKGIILSVLDMMKEVLMHVEKRSLI